jgi:hypothetical protein
MITDLERHYSLTAQSFDTSPEIEVFALCSLSILLAGNVFVTCKISLVRTPTIRAESGDAERFKRGFKFSENNILPLSKDKCRDTASFMIRGKPKPTLILLGSDKAPYFVKLGFGCLFPR